MSRSVRLLVIVLLAIGLGGMRPHLAWAATVSDCPTTESALSTDISNAGSGGTVAFTCSAATTIPFTSTITISQSVTLDASGASGAVTFDGGSTTQLLVVNGGVSLKSLTLAHGSAGDGGAILNQGGTVTITGSTLSDNFASDGGGAIANFNATSTLNITATTFSGNSASSFGGAINNQGTTTIAASTFSGNSAAYGGAIYHWTGTTTVSTSTLSGNSTTSGGHGGAILVNSGTVNVSASTLSGNSATDSGGAIANFNAGSTVNINDSTVSGNSTTGSGGAIDNQGTVSITASTLSGNSSSFTGAISNSGTVSIGGSIMANGSSGGNCAGAITDIGYNLSDDSSCGFSAAKHDLVNTNPQLGPLQNNGGPTQTMALLSNSPAMDQVPTASCPSTDQRGDPRPDRTGETTCDMGAYESSYIETTTTLTSSPNSPVSGQSVTFTATITPSGSGSPSPTGTVDFFDGGTKIGSGTVSTSNGITTASFSTSSLSVGSHTITATYNGDATYAWSSVSGAQHVSPASPSIVTTPGGTVVLGSGAKLSDSATLSSGSSPSGTITFSLFAPGVTPNPSGSNAVYADTVTVSGNGTYTTAAGTNPGGFLPTVAGTYQWVASYSGDGNNNTAASSFGSEPETVTSAGPSLTTTATPGQGTVGAMLKDSATLSGGYSPTGTITFTLHQGSCTGTVLDTETVTVTGNGSYSTPTGYAGTAVGSYDWVASYSGDSNNTGVTSACELVTLGQASTTTSVSSSANPSTAGQAVSFTASVSVTAPGAGTPTGTVQFSIDGTNFGSPVALNGSGQATSPSTSTLSPGVHTVSATYSGDTNFGGSSGTLPGGQTVNQAPAITSANHATFTVGSPGSFAVTTTGFPHPSLTGSGNLPSGVSFVDNHNGTASLSGTPAVGTAGVYYLTITASNGVGSPATQAFTLTVVAGNTTTTFSSSVNPSSLHQAVTFTATVSSAGGIPTGTVTFTEGGITLATVPLDSSGKASFTTSSLGVGTHTITASYSGSSLYPGSSASLRQQVGYNICPIQLPFQGVTSGHIKIKLQLCDAAGNDLSSPNITLTVIGVSPSPGVAGPSGTFSFIPLLGGTNGGYQYSVDTTGYRSGTYTLLFTVAGDPVTHGVQFTVT